MIRELRKELEFELPCVGHGRRIFDCYKYEKVKRRDENILRVSGGEKKRNLTREKR